MNKKFCDTRNFLKHRSVLQRIFSVLCDKKLSTEKRNTPPLWCFKNFDTRNFLIHGSVPQPSFSVLWDKKFWLKIVICPLLSIKIYSIPKSFFWNTEGFLYKAFRFGPVRQKISTKPWSFPPPLLENFRYQNSFETQKCFPTNFIGTVRQKFFNGA